MMSFFLSPHPVGAVFLPLGGAVLAGIGGRFWGARFAGAMACLCVILSAVFSAALLPVAQAGATTTLIAPWFAAGDLHVDWAVRVDTLSAVMMATVTFVSAMVYLYALSYMKGDPGFARFMGYLALFTFFMLMLVSADNLVQMFFGWEGVGLCSYLLINFWYEKPAANKAGLKAFLVNRVGDAGFVLGLVGCYAAFGTVQFEGMFARLGDIAGEGYRVFGAILPHATLLALLLFVGAMGKSAQLGLHVWLPDAMEGPTPVSALIHAATMVTAGVFMIARLSPLFAAAPGSLAVIALVGGGTALFAATLGVFQTDIKRVIAYSTMSQLGYMFFAAGVGAYGAAMFHLTTHAFFKALLFLGAGAVIHAVAGEQDMRKMGGLWRKMPVTYALMWIGTLALTGIGIEGVGGFAGFYSKDAILEAARTRDLWYGPLVYGLGIAAAVLTAFYSLRLILLTFHGAPHETQPQAHEASWTMLVPLVPLAAGAVFGGALGAPWFVGARQDVFWENVLSATSQSADKVAGAHGFMPWMPLVAALAGFALAAFLYARKGDVPARMAAACPRLLTFAKGGFGVDAFYERLFVRGAEKTGRILAEGGDARLIDAWGPDGVSLIAQRLGRRISWLQSGHLYHYAFAMVLGLVALVSWFFGAWHWIWR